MEEEICQYSKFGFCKYRNECKKKHFIVECEDPDCKTQKSCDKRHPKRCRKHDLGRCRFENECAYKHLKPANNQDHEELKVKVAALEKTVQEITKTNKDNEEFKEKFKVLEKVLHAMTRKVLYLETALKDIKEKSNIEHVKEKENETKDEASDGNLSFNFNHKDLKGSSSTPNNKNDKYDESDLKVEMLSCKECKYSCKKEKSLKNHMLTKHEIHQCKECQEKLPTLMQLLKHMAKHHTDNENKTKDIQSEENKVHKEEKELEELEGELSSLKKELS